MNNSTLNVNPDQFQSFGGYFDQVSFGDFGTTAGTRSVLLQAAIPLKQIILSQIEIVPCSVGFVTLPGSTLLTVGLGYIEGASNSIIWSKTIASSTSARFVGQDILHTWQPLLVYPASKDLRIFLTILGAAASTTIWLISRVRGYICDSAGISFGAAPTTIPLSAIVAA